MRVNRETTLFFERERAGQTGSTCGNVFIITFNKAVGGKQRQKERMREGKRKRKRERKNKPKWTGCAKKYLHLKNLSAVSLPLSCKYAMCCCHNPLDLYFSLSSAPLPFLQKLLYVCVCM